MKNFSSITVDNYDAAQDFKLFLQNMLLSIDLTDDTLKNESKLKILSNEVSKKAKDVETVYKNAVSKYIRKSAVYAFGTMTAILFLLNTQIIETIKLLIGAGATGLMPFLNLIADYFNEKTILKNNETYYLWLLRKGNK